MYLNRLRYFLITLTILSGITAVAMYKTNEGLQETIKACQIENQRLSAGYYSKGMDYIECLKERNEVRTVNDSLWRANTQMRIKLERGEG